MWASGSAGDPDSPNNLSASDLLTRHDVDLAQVAIFGRDPRSVVYQDGVAVSCVWPGGHHDPVCGSLHCGADGRGDVHAGVEGPFATQRIKALPEARSH